DCLPFVDRVALADEHLVAMRVGRDPAIRVLDQHEIAVAAQFVADISDDAALDRFDRGAARGRDVDPVIVRPVSRDAVARQHMAVHRPGEPAAGALDGRRRCGWRAGAAARGGGPTGSERVGGAAAMRGDGGSSSGMISGLGPAEAGGGAIACWTGAPAPGIVKRLPILTL